MEPRLLVCLLGLAGMLSAADNWVVSPVLPAVAEAFGVPVATAGIVLTAYLLPYGLMQPVYGHLADRHGKAMVLCAILAGLGLGTLGCALAGSLLALCLWRAATGFFAAGIIAVSLSLIGDAVPVARRQGQVGLFMGMVFLGQGLSVGLGGVFARYASWRLSFACLAILAFALLPFLRRLPRSIPPADRRSFVKELRRIVTAPLGRVIFPLALATGFLLLGAYSYLGAFLHEAAGLDYFQVGLVVMGYGFACLAAGTQVGRLGRTLGQKRVVLAGSCLGSGSLALLTVAPSWWGGLFATVGLGFGYICIQSTLATLAFEVDPDNKGLPSALIGLGLFGGGSLGTAFGGWLLPRIGYGGLWLVLGAGVALLGLCAGVMPRWAAGPIPASATREGSGGQRS